MKKTISLVLFFLALEMILGIKIHKDEMPETATIVPIAFPLIAGAGTMTKRLYQVSRHGKNMNVAIGRRV